VSPTGGETGKSNAEITADFVIWNRQTQLGEVFDSSSCFHLPNGADRSPDVSWIKQERVILHSKKEVSVKLNPLLTSRHLIALNYELNVSM
jgi:Uma2 family endonuclease